jgi:diguanylate cyclase (GGDEF)-like protein
MRFRLTHLSFHSRLLICFVGLIILSLLGTSTVMFFAARRTGLGLAEEQLHIASRVVEKALEDEDQQLRAQTTALASDFGFREAVTSQDKPTIVSALENQRARMRADVFALVDDNGTVLASADPQFEKSSPVSLDIALSAARSSNTSPTILNYAGRLLQVVMLPVKAPDTIGWVFVGSYIGDPFVTRIKDVAGSDISVLTQGSDSSRFVVVASTLSASAQAALAAAAGALSARGPSAHERRLGDESFLTFFSQGRNSVGDTFSVVLQMPMAAVAAPLDALRSDLFVFGGLLSALCLIAAVFGARTLAEPVRALSNAARSLSMSKRRSSGAAGDDELAHVARAFHALARRAHYDGLTGLPNRALLVERLSESLERMESQKQSLAVVFIDLNGFKKINDSLGHEMGDLVLRKTAQRLSRSVVSPNTVARLGGDEFVLVLEDISQTDAMRVVEGLASVVSKSMASTTGSISVGMSAGIAMYPAVAVDREQLLQLADAAMYQSKTKKTGPVMATVLNGPAPESLPSRPMSESAPALQHGDTSSVNVWVGRDLVTQSTRAVTPLSAQAASIPRDEQQRLIALRKLKYLDKPPRASFDRVTRLAAKCLNVPVALVSLVDENRQWFLSRVGLDVTETPREVSFCAHAVFQRQPLVVPDATRDDRFAGNPLVTHDPKIRAYAGAPLYTPEGHAVGTLCVIDKKPREFDAIDLQTLQDLAQIVEDIIRVRQFTLVYDKRRSKAKASKPFKSKQLSTTE